MSNNHGATSLTGGGAGAVDALASAGLTTGDCVYTITSTGLYCHRYDSTSATAESSPDVIAPDDIAGGNGRWLWVAFFGADVLTELLKLYDTDKSHTLSIKWNEDDSGDRVLNLLVAGGDRSLTLNENLTIGDGGNVTITAEDAAGSITLDNASLEVEDTVGSGNTIKFVIGTDDASRTVTLSENLTIGDGNAGTITFTGASKTLSVEDDAVVNQDLTTDAGVTFAAVTGNGILTVKPDGTNEVLQVNDGTVDFSDGNAGTAGVMTIDASGNISFAKNFAAVDLDGIIGSNTPAAATVTTLGIGGTVSCADNLVGRPVIKDYGEVVDVIGSDTTPECDLESGNVFTDTIDTGATTYTFSNPPASGTMGSFTLMITNGGSQTVTWPGSVDWEDGTAPTLTTAGLDILVFWTIDAGTIWHGAVASLDSK